MSTHSPAALTPCDVRSGDGSVVRLDHLTVVVSGSPEIGRQLYARLRALRDDAGLDFESVAGALQDMVVRSGPDGVAAVLDGPTPVAFLFDQAVLRGGTNLAAQGRAGWTTEVVTPGLVELRVGSIDGVVDPRIELVQGRVGGSGATITLLGATSTEAETEVSSEESSDPAASPIALDSPEESAWSPAVAEASPSMLDPEAADLVPPVGAETVASADEGLMPSPSAVDPLAGIPSTFPVSDSGDPTWSTPAATPNADQTDDQPPAHTPPPPPGAWTPSSHQDAAPPPGTTPPTPGATPPPPPPATEWNPPTPGSTPPPPPGATPPIPGATPPPPPATEWTPQESSATPGTPPPLADSPWNQPPPPPRTPPMPDDSFAFPPKGPAVGSPPPIAGSEQAEPTPWSDELADFRPDVDDEKPDTDSWPPPPR